MNVFTFTGYVGKDANLGTTQTGTKFLNFSVGTHAGFGDNKTDFWVQCTLWGKRGESMAHLVTKGMRLAISGEAALREFEKDGQQRKVLGCRVTEIELLGDPPKQEAKTETFEDDIPF